MPKKPITNSRRADTIEWLYVDTDGLPDEGVTLLIAELNEDSDEVILGYREGGQWWTQDDMFIDRPVYAYAEAPAKPAWRKGTEG